MTFLTTFQHQVFQVFIMPLVYIHAHVTVLKGSRCMTEVENNGKEYYVRTGTGYKQITVATNKNWI